MYILHHLSSMSNITSLYDTKAYYVLVLIARTKAINYTDESHRPAYIQLIDIFPKRFGTEFGN